MFTTRRWTTAVAAPFTVAIGMAIMPMQAHASVERSCAGLMEGESVEICARALQESINAMGASGRDVAADPKTVLLRAGLTEPQLAGVEIIVELEERIETAIVIDIIRDENGKIKKIRIYQE